jgi:N-dimethylarginine dimethylaminohydrolase
VFTANPSFTGLGADGRRISVLSRMRHASRQREVAAHRAWFAARGYEVVESPVPFEGGGDAIWHPGQRAIWGGHGQRSAPEAYPFLARVFGVETRTLELTTDFYHLDTCLCPLDRETALVFPAAFTRAGLALLRRHFARLVEADEGDARDRFACNALVTGRHVVIQRGCTALEARLEDLGFDVHPVETGEFLKSGGSVYCLKQWVF